MSAGDIAGVMFDFEGTLVDFQWKLKEGEAALRRAFVALGVPEERLIGRNYSSMWNQTLCDRDLAVADGPLDEARLRRLVGPVYDRFDEDALGRWRPRDGAAEVLRGLRAIGIRAALVSNIGRAALSQALVRFEFDGYLSPVLSRDDVCYMKPDPEGIRRVVDEWGIAPERALFVGDSRTDIRAARAAGVPVAIIRGGESSADALASEPPDHLLDGLSEVLTLVS